MEYVDSHNQTIISFTGTSLVIYYLGAKRRAKLKHMREKWYRLTVSANKR